MTEDEAVQKAIELGLTENQAQALIFLTNHSLYKNPKTYPIPDLEEKIELTSKSSFLFPEKYCKISCEIYYYVAKEENKNGFWFPELKFLQECKPDHYEVYQEVLNTHPWYG